MPTSLVSTGVQFPDSTIQTTAAAASGVVTATASGALPNGAVVVVNSDGTVSAVNDTSGTGTVTGTESVINTMTSGGTANSFWDANTSRVVVAYRNENTGGRPTVIAGSVNFSTGVISWGSNYELDTVGALGNIRIAYDTSASRFVFAWSNNYFPYVAYVRNATLSGTDFTLGTLTTMDPPKCIDQQNLMYATASNNLVCVYSDELGGSTGYTWARTLTNSGSTINLGTAVNFTGSTVYSQGIKATYDIAAQRVLLVARNSSSGATYSIVGSVSGSSLTFGSITTVGSSFTTVPLVMYYDLASSKSVFLIGDTSATTSVVATVSGLTVSFGTPTVIDGTYLSTPYAAPTPTGTLLAYTKSGYLTTIWGTVSGTTVSWTSSSSTSIPENSNPTLVYTGASNKRFISAYLRTSSTFRASLMYQGNLTSTNFIGFSSAAYNSGDTATINTAGSSNNAQTGLSAGSAYYVQLTGTLSTTAGSPSVFAGTAVSSTRILVKG